MSNITQGQDRSTDLVLLIRSLQLLLKERTYQLPPKKTKGATLPRMHMTYFLSFLAFYRLGASRTNGTTVPFNVPNVLFPACHAVKTDIWYVQNRTFKAKRTNGTFLQLTYHLSYFTTITMPKRTFSTMCPS